MSMIECIRLALDSIRSNKMRAVLTMLGIIIGISSVITITTIGNSLQQTIANTLNDVGGTNVIYGYVTADYPEDMTDEEWDAYEYPTMEEDDMISLQQIMEFEDAFAGEVKSVAINENLGSGTVTGEAGTVNVTVNGISSGYIDSMKLDLLRGRDISRRDLLEGKATAVVSDLFVKYAFGDVENPIGQEIEVALSDGTVVKAYIVGVYEYNAKSFGTVGQTQKEKDISTMVGISLTYAERFASYDMEGYSYLSILTEQGADAAVLAEDIAQYFNNGVYGDNKDFKFECYDLSSQLGMINSVLTVITIAISVIAGISLIVGGVGVMNIMLVSVVERTSEIGIRKALGAKNSSIRMQFLIEAVAICLIGGIIGILIGIANGFLLSEVAAGVLATTQSEVAGYLTVSVSPSIPAIVISVLFSMATGVIFGYYPANRAAKMSPIDALRYE